MLCLMRMNKTLNIELTISASYYLKISGDLIKKTVHGNAPDCLQSDTAPF